MALLRAKPGDDSHYRVLVAPTEFAKSGAVGTGIEHRRVHSVVNYPNLGLRVSQLVDHVRSLPLRDTEVRACPSIKDPVELIADSTAWSDVGHVVHPHDRVCDPREPRGDAAEGFGAVAPHHYDVGLCTAEDPGQFRQCTQGISFRQVQCTRFDSRCGQRVEERALLTDTDDRWRDARRIHPWKQRGDMTLGSAGVQVGYDEGDPDWSGIHGATSR